MIRQAPAAGVAQERWLRITFRYQVDRQETEALAIQEPGILMFKECMAR